VAAVLVVARAAVCRSDLLVVAHLVAVAMLLYRVVRLRREMLVVCR
jgi:hypothetical protein